MSVQIDRYRPTDQAAWDDFVSASKNGIFLFLRAYMEYHHDRFTDHSLIAYEGGRIIALLPANQRANELVSHGGLTFGGWISGEGMKQMLMIAVFDALKIYAAQHKITYLIYKPVPYIYTRAPAQEDLYALFLHSARLIERRPMTVIQGSPPLNKDRRYAMRRAQKIGIIATESRDLAAYWVLLEHVLAAQHDAKPVHTLTEIEQLALLFSDHIRLFGAFEGSEMIAGVLIYISNQVTRTQYIASNERGRATGALELLIDHLLHKVFADKAYFDFGTSIEPKGGSLNPGLIAHKEDFSGRSIMCDTYELVW